MKPGPSRSWLPAFCGAAVVAALITGCSSGSTASPGTTPPAAGSAGSASATSPAAKASSGSTAVAVATKVDVAVACENLLAIDAIPSPDSGPPPAADSSSSSAAGAADAGPDGSAPGSASAGSGAESGEPPTDPAANKAFGEAVEPLLESALAAAPAELAVHLTALQPYLAAAIADGTAFPQEDPAFFGGLVGYETWAHQNCGFQNVDLMGVDYKFEGAPTTLKAGPTSFALMNHSDKGEFHVATFAKLKEGKQITLEQVIALPFEQIFEYVDLLPGAAAAPPGATGGVLVDLTPGTYFMVCPVSSDENDPATAHMLKGMANQFVVS